MARLYKYAYYRLGERVSAILQDFAVPGVGDVWRDGGNEFKVIGSQPVNMTGVEQAQVDHWRLDVEPTDAPTPQPKSKEAMELGRILGM